MLSVVQHRGLHQDHRAEGDVEVGADDREFFELVLGALAQRRFCVGFGCHGGLLRLCYQSFGDWRGYAASGGHHKIAIRPNTPISISRAATVMAIGRMAS